MHFNDVWRITAFYSHINMSGTWTEFFDANNLIILIENYQVKTILLFVKAN